MHSRTTVAVRSGFPYCESSTQVDEKRRNTEVCADLALLLPRRQPLLQRECPDLVADHLRGLGTSAKLPECFPILVLQGRLGGE